MNSVKAPILKILEDYICEKKLTITQFAECSGLHSGTLSNLVHGHRPISIHQLDLITVGMGKEEGAFYDLFIDEYIVDKGPNWRRVRPLLSRCAELDRLDSMKRVVLFLTERLMYLPMLFDTAETFLASGFRDAAVILYESVAEGERFQHSERLALCQYRLFVIALGIDQEANRRLAHKFEAYVDRLDDADQLDALKRLADVYASLHSWEPVRQLADKMGKKAKICSAHPMDKQPERPLLYYRYYAHLLNACVYDARGEYGQALDCTSLYGDLTEGTSPIDYTEEERRVIIQFQEWACANTYVYRLMSGETEVLREYVEFVGSRPDEIPTALNRIVRAANLHQMDIDDVLLRFRENLDYYEQHSRLGKVNRQITEERYACFLAELASYYLRTKKVELGLNHVLVSLRASSKIRNDHIILRCISLFEQYWDKASSSQHKEYEFLIQKVRDWLPEFVASYRNARL